MELAEVGESVPEVLSVKNHDVFMLGYTGRMKLAKAMETIYQAIIPLSQLFRSRSLILMKSFMVKIMMVLSNIYVYVDCMLLLHAINEIKMR